MTTCHDGPGHAESAVWYPLGSGLSSSAAVERGVALALDDVAGLGQGGDDAGRARLAAACVRAENEIAGAPTGGLDQATSLRAHPGRALLLGCRDFTVSLLPLDLAAAGPVTPATPQCCSGGSGTW